jgi:hypothetical protein
MDIVDPNTVAEKIDTVEPSLPNWRRLTALPMWQKFNMDRSDPIRQKLLKERELPRCAWSLIETVEPHRNMAKTEEHCVKPRIDIEDPKAKLSTIEILLPRRVRLKTETAEESLAKCRNETEDPIFA